MSEPCFALELYLEGITSPELQEELLSRALKAKRAALERAVATVSEVRDKVARMEDELGRAQARSRAARRAQAQASAQELANCMEDDLSGAGLTETESHQAAQPTGVTDNGSAPDSMVGQSDALPGLADVGRAGLAVYLASAGHIGRGVMAMVWPDLDEDELLASGDLVPAPGPGRFDDWLVAGGDMARRVAIAKGAVESTWRNWQEQRGE